MTSREVNFQDSIQELTPLHGSFPSRLRDIPDCPGTIYINGELPPDTEPAVAVVGARDATEHGLDIARGIGTILAENGISVISGMAYGIDSAAHRGALEGGGKTYAVLGCGLNICYPPSGFRLYEDILRGGGGLISEFPMGSPPLGWHFVSRNRIISGLSDAVVVVEAKARSGTLITVEYALNQGKQIFAVPGRMTDRLSEGCNRLIKDGACILSSPEDILDYLNLKEKRSIIPKPLERLLNEEQKALYNQLDTEAVHIDKISEQSSLPINKLSMLLLELELLGLCELTRPGYYRKRLRADEL